MDGEDPAQRLGHRVRQLRQGKKLRPARVAEAVACDRSYISHLEAGRRWPSLRVAQRLDQVLDAGGALVALWAELDAARPRQPALAPARQPMPTAISMSSPPVPQTRYAPVWLTMLAADTLDAANNGKEPATDRFQYYREVTAHGLPAVRESVQLAIQLEGPAGGPLTREQLTQAIDHYALGYGAVPALLLFDEVRACRRLAAQVLRHQRDDAPRRELYRAAGWLSALLGNLSFHLADSVGAKLHLTLAWQLGSRAGEGRLLAWTRGAQSMVALWEGDHQHALELARDGLTQATTPLLRAQLLAWAQLRALARLGERSDALRVLAEATDQLAKDPHGGTPGRFGFDHAEFELHTAEAHLALGQPADAHPHAEAAVTLKDPGSNGWAAGMLTLARIDALQDRPDQAADCGLLVLAELPLGRLRETNRRRAVALGRLLAGHPAVPQVRKFHERVQALPPRPALPPVEPPSTP